MRASRSTHVNPLSLEGEGFPPDARSAANGGKGEGGFILDGASRLTPHRAPKARVLSPKGRAGEAV